MKDKIFIGGCLCGELRYEGRNPIDAGYCHCRICQRSTGAPLLAWVTFPIADFSFVKGEPTIYRSSPRGVRNFCSNCGTQIAFHGDETHGQIDVNIGSLDDPGQAVPEYHIWVGSRVPWLHIDDELPRYTADGPASTSS